MDGGEASSRLWGRKFAARIFRLDGRSVRGGEREREIYVRAGRPPLLLGDGKTCERDNGREMRWMANGYGGGLIEMSQLRVFA